MTKEVATTTIDAAALRDLADAVKYAATEIESGDRFGHTPQCVATGLDSYFLGVTRAHGTNDRYRSVLEPFTRYSFWARLNWRSGVYLLRALAAAIRRDADELEEKR